MALKWGSPPATPMGAKVGKRCERFKAFGLVKVTADGGGGGGGEFPSFLPKEIAKIRDPFARNLAQRIVRLPVKVLLAFSVSMFLFPYLWWFDQLLMTCTIHCLQFGTFFLFSQMIW